MSTADLIVRCSSIGRLMSSPEKSDLDPAYVTPEVAAALAKTKRSDEEKALIEHARRHSLSAGGKTHVRELVREAIYGFEPADIETRPILKGRAVEASCIELLAKLTGRPLVKNSQRRSNGLISGECDIFDAEIKHGRDIKAPYSMESMPIVLADCYDSGYEWQMRGYMALWDCETWSVDYVLVSTPEEFIGFEPQHLHFVDHIDERHRWTTWTVRRDRDLESLIFDKVQAARRYYRQVVAEFDRTHADPAEVAAMAAAGHAPPWEEPRAPSPAPITKPKASAPMPLEIHF